MDGAEVSLLKAVTKSNVNLLQDLYWLMQERQGEPERCVQAEHSWEFVEGRYIADHNPHDPGLVKLRKLRCRHCAKYWVHA